MPSPPRPGAACGAAAPKAAGLALTPRIRAYRKSRSAPNSRTPSTVISALALPLAVWILASFFRELPEELEDAARIDGCGHFQVLWRIMIPLAAPGVFTAAILVFIYAWNEFFFALLVITVSFLVAILFFGGWHFPWIAEAGSAYTGAAFVKVLVLLVKVFALILFIMLIRWTIPRYRYDQLMSLVWRGLIPLTVLNLVCVIFVKQFALSEVWLLPASLAVSLAAWTQPAG